MGSLLSGESFSNEFNTLSDPRVSTKFYEEPVSLNIKPDFDDVAVLDDILFAVQAAEVLFLSLLLGTGGNQMIVRDR